MPTVSRDTWKRVGNWKTIDDIDNRKKKQTYPEPAASTVSPEPSLLAHTSNESRGTFRQKARSLAPLNGWACAVKICYDAMLEDTNSLDGAQFSLVGT